MSTVTAHRYHDICAGHRVVGHESKCRHLHGHNYRVYFYCEGEQALALPEVIGGDIPSVNAQNGLDELGRVIDFSIIKEKLCMWIEDKWDHKFLHWVEDPMIHGMKRVAESCLVHNHVDDKDYFVAKTQLESYVSLPFNPTAENLALHLLHTVGPKQLKGTGVTLTKVVIEETAKCAVTVEL